MTLQLVVDNTKTAAATKRIDTVNNVAPFTIVRLGDFVGMLNKDIADFPYIADNHSAQLELFPNDEIEIVLTHKELAEYWLAREKPTPNYPVVLRAYDAKCRWVCGEICNHHYKWICPNCEQEASANGEDFGRYFFQKRKLLRLPSNRAGSKPASGNGRHERRAVQHFRFLSQHYRKLKRCRSVYSTPKIYRDFPQKAKEHYYAKGCSESISTRLQKMKVFGFNANGSVARKLDAIS